MAVNINAVLATVKLAEQTATRAKLTCSRLDQAAKAAVGWRRPSNILLGCTGTVPAPVPAGLTAGAYKNVMQGWPARINRLSEQSGMGPTGCASAVSTRL